MPSDDGKKPENKPDPKNEGKTFTQADLEHEIGERLKRERAKYADYDELKAKAAKLDDQEAESKSAIDKLTEKVEALTKSQGEAEARALRAEVATAKGLTAPQAKRLAGTTREELEADADEILEAFPVSKDPDKKPSPPSRQPKPDLRGGGDPSEEPTETDPAKLADSVPRL